MSQSATQNESPNSPSTTNDEGELKPSLLDQAIENTTFTDPTSYLMDVKAFDQIQRIAKMYERSSLIPQHLRCFDHADRYDEAGTIANVSLVIMQAFRWKIDPAVCMAHSYELRGRLGYEGKLVAAIVNTRGGIEGRLKYDHKGSGKDRTVIVSGKFKGETEIRTVELTYKDAVTRDKQGKEKEAWTRDPDQKLCYGGATKWARRHCPEVIAGVYIEDDLDRIEAEGASTDPVTPEGNSDQQKPKSRGDQMAETSNRTEKPTEKPKKSVPKKKTEKPAAKKDPDSKVAKKNSVPGQTPIPADCPPFPGRVETIVREMVQAKDSVDLQQIIARNTNPQSIDFDTILAIGDWLRDKGYVKPPTDPRQGQMFDRTKQPD